jgi:hypothetical protein
MSNFEDYVYGRTSMCKALEISLLEFEKNICNEKVLIIISDG